MATPKHDATAEADAPADLNGRLVLATGTVVVVPAEGCQVATHHYDDTVKATVPVVNAFVLTPDEA
jgi:hypothetical protein